MIPRNPMQPLIKDGDRGIRFKENAIVRQLLDFATERGMGLNELHGMPFTQDDRTQFAQLIGYSLNGFHELSYVADEDALDATERARAAGLYWARGCRDGEGCSIHSGVKRE